MTPEVKAERKRLRRASRLLQGDEDEPDYAELERVAAWCKQHEIEADSYGEADALQAFEARVAAMLGYPAARFMPSGTMAQQIAMRIWSDGAGCERIGLHPTSHLLLHEQQAFERVHRLSAALIGDAGSPMTTEDLAACPETLSALIIELPTRENGGQLAPWDGLVALTSAARERGIAVHLDGARLWEAAAGYERSHDEICELFDSTYVSFYKGIGALPGSVLAGPKEFIAEAALWQRRHGGELFTMLANWVSADMRLDTQIAKMPAFRDRAIEIAHALTPIAGLTLNPAVPQVNMFHAFLHGGKEELLEARDRAAEDRGIWLFGGMQATAAPNLWEIEVTIGDAAMNLDLAEIVAAFETLTSATG